MSEDRFIVSKGWDLPPEGILLPTRIVLPSTVSSKASIQQSAAQLGLNIPQSLTRQDAVKRMEILLKAADYKEGEISDLLIRDRPVRVLPYQYSEAPQPSILPAVINKSLFDTKDSLIKFINQNNLQPYIRSGAGRLKGDLVRDLHRFLINQGYIVNPSGDFIRGAPLEMAQEYEYQDLIKPEDYVRFLHRTEGVPIVQGDLLKLQITTGQLLSLLPRRRWPDLNALIMDISQAVDINPGLALLIMLLSRLHSLTLAGVQSILTQIGDQTSYRSNQQRISALLGYMKTRLLLTPRIYPQKTDLKNEVAPEGMSLDEVISGGYLFDPDIYIERASYHSYPKFHRKYLADLYRRYPELYLVSKEYRPGNKLTERLIELYYGGSYSYPQGIYAFTVNHPLVIPESEERKRRRVQIEELPQNYRESLYGIYRTNSIENIIDQPQHPLEIYLQALPKVNVDQLKGVALQFGMIVPEHLLRSEIRNYILEKIPSYREIMNRSPDTPPLDEAFERPPETFEEFLTALEVYPDTEIIGYFGYSGGMTNRESLIWNIFRTIQDEGFLIYQRVPESRTVNAETTMLTSIRDVPQPYLVFGTPFQYRVLELDELIQTFRGGRFLKVGVTRNEAHTRFQISRLLILLPIMKRSNPQLSASVDLLLQIVHSGLTANLRRTQEVDRFIRSVQKIPRDRQEVIKRLFYQVFYLGMYMRKWRGPGNRYPSQEVESMGGIDPDPKVVMALGIFYNLLGQLPEGLNFNELTVVNYNTQADEVTFDEILLYDLIRGVAQRTVCIRDASRSLVLSAYYYIGVVFGESVPDFNPYSVESIS